MTAVRQETAKVKTFSLALPKWQPHRAGQHYDIRLTAEDGYRAQRSYSIASEPQREGEVDLTIELVENGEVSTFLHQSVVAGDFFEVRGPIGGYFVWEATQGGPLLLVGGGSGVVPLMAMLRHRAAVRANVPSRLLYSSRTCDDVIYRDELDGFAAKADGFELFHTLTRAQPPRWAGYARRIDEDMLRDVSRVYDTTALAFICGPTALVENAANALVRLGLRPERIRTERFGPSAT